MYISRVCIINMDSIKRGLGIWLLRWQRWLWVSPCPAERSHDKNTYVCPYWKVEWGAHLVFSLYHSFRSISFASPVFQYPDTSMIFTRWPSFEKILFCIRQTTGTERATKERGRIVSTSYFRTVQMSNCKSNSQVHVLYIYMDNLILRGSLFPVLYLIPRQFAGLSLFKMFAVKWRSRRSS